MKSECIYLNGMTKKHRCMKNTTKTKTENSVFKKEERMLSPIQKVRTM